MAGREHNPDDAAGKAHFKSNNDDDDKVDTNQDDSKTEIGDRGSASNFVIQQNTQKISYWTWWWLQLYTIDAIYYASIDKYGEDTDYNYDDNSSGSSEAFDDSDSYYSEYYDNENYDVGLYWNYETSESSVDHSIVEYYDNDGNSTPTEGCDNDYAGVYRNYDTSDSSVDHSVVEYYDNDGDSTPTEGCDDDNSGLTEGCDDDEGGPIEIYDSNNDTSFFGFLERSNAYFRNIIRRAFCSNQQPSK